MQLAQASADLFAQQESNRKASRRLVAGFIAFVAWLGFGADIIWYYASSREAAARVAEGLSPNVVHHFPGIGILFLAVALIIIWWAFAFGPAQIISSTGAREITAPVTPTEGQLMNVVDEMSIASGVPRPRIWIIPDDAPNALTTGTDAASAQLAVTQGLLDTSSRDELQAVIAHEMGHISNLDVRLMTLLTALVGLVAFVHGAAFRVMRFGGGSGGGSGRGSSSRSRGGGGAGGILVIALAVVWVISWLIAPLVTRFVVMKVGRSREFLADAMSAQYTRNPGALADALEKISSSTAEPDAIPSSSAQLCIMDPSSSGRSERKGRWADLMATHPPVAERVARLRQMAYQPVERLDPAPDA